MDFTKSRSVRFQDGLDVASFTTGKPVENGIKLAQNIEVDRTQIPSSNTKKVDGLKNTDKSLKAREVLSRVFSEDYEKVKIKIMDPRGPILHRWNKIFLIACLVSLFIDPLFLYLLSTSDNMCVDFLVPLEVVLTTIRSIVDVFYMIQIFVRFRTAFVAPSSRVFGRGELVVDPSKIASKYLAKDFWLDLIAALPLPQVFIWAVIPHVKGLMTNNTKNAIRFSIFSQYLPRLYLIFPLSSQIIKATGLVTETAWAGAAYNLILYMLASHVLGACWYLFSIERQEACWGKVCNLEMPSCQSQFFDCRVKNSLRDAWFESSNITALCSPTSSFFPFGIYVEALSFKVTSSSFIKKYFYCLWWGLKNLSCLGQNLSTSTYIGEITFAIIIAIVGLVLFGLLIGNMQVYLQSTTKRLEEWRIRRTDTEQWMHHRQLPPYLRQSVRRYEQYKWVATRGVDEEALLKSLPMDLRRDIKRHLCLDLVRRVPLFDQMDHQMLDAICERLKPALCTQRTCLVREGDPVNEMLFIIRGCLDSYTTNGGRTGFFNSCRIGPGDFCGEELLTWALDPRPSIILPSSMRTVKAISEVEAFALVADDLKFVASQFRRMHSKKLEHKFRCYSPQWRTWAACFIQLAWRQYKRRRERSVMADEVEIAAATPPGSRFEMYVARLAASTRRGGVSEVISSVQKPVDEPDFMFQEEQHAVNIM